MILPKLDQLDRFTKYLTEQRNFLLTEADVLSDSGDWALILYYPANWKEGQREFHPVTRNMELVYQQRLVIQIANHIIREIELENEEVHFRVLAGNLEVAYDELKFIPPENQKG